MAIIHDLIEISGLLFQTELTFGNGGLIGVFDDVEKIRNPSDPDREYNNGDTIIVDGTAYTINQIYHPNDNASRIVSDNGTTTIANKGDDNVDLLILSVSNGADVRYFLIPSDTLGDLPNITSITLGAYKTAAGSDATLDAFANNTVTICFTQGTLIKTITGEHPVETLAVGDLVLTMDNGFQPIRWIGSQRLTADDLALKPELRPVRITSGALGAGLPQRDLLVSRHHRILSRSQIARNMVGCPEVLVAAKDLVFLGGIGMANDIDQVIYWHFMFDTHQVVYAEGAPAESLFAGPEALKAVGPDALKEIFAIMPELSLRAERREADMARPELKGRRARQFAGRHAIKSRALLTKP